jgi:hypothetical protein
LQVVFQHDQLNAILLHDDSSNWETA